MTEMNTRCGYVALIGRPNVGKSTLLNHILRQKISITSRKPQTTRSNLVGIDTQGNHQAIYVDTPGIHQRTERRLNEYMVDNATSALSEVNVRVMLIEAGRWHDEDQYVLELLKTTERNGNLAVLSKVDQISDKQALLPELQRIHEFGVFDALLPVSALKNEGVQMLREEVFTRLPSGPHLFDADQVTNQTERYLVAEIVREKLMRQLGDEIPHSAAVLVENFKNNGQVIEIDADIYVERAGQKRIVIGQQGQRLKLIGQEARKDIERLLDARVMLRLWVKVRKGWTNSANLMGRLGYK